MKIAIIGNGAMGRLVSARANEEGHAVQVTLTSRDAARDVTELAKLLRGVDAAIDFSVAAAIEKNVEACARAGVPLVEGTTGWNARQADIFRIIEEHNGALLYGANFSVGVNLFYRIVTRAAELFAKVNGYAPFIEEAHHARKRDAPSGTAFRLRDLLSEHLKTHDIPVASTRAGHIPGTHRVGFDSAADQITLTHTARTREGFAAGALLAAKWLVDRKGIYEFSEVMEDLIQ